MSNSVFNRTTREILSPRQHNRTVDLGPVRALSPRADMHKKAVEKHRQRYIPEHAKLKKQLNAGFKELGRN
jgi:hypothetical protein